MNKKILDYLVFEIFLLDNFVHFNMSIFKSLLDQTIEAVFFMQLDKLHAFKVVAQQVNKNKPSWYILFVIHFKFVHDILY